MKPLVNEQIALLVMLVYLNSLYPDGSERIIYELNSSQPPLTLSLSQLQIPPPL